MLSATEATSWMTCWKWAGTNGCASADMETKTLSRTSQNLTQRLSEFRSLSTSAARDRPLTSWTTAEKAMTSFASDGIRTNTIVEPTRIVFSESDVEGGMTTSITFRDLGDGRTEAVTHQTNVPEMFRTPEARAGFESSLDRCAAYLATLV